MFPAENGRYAVCEPIWLCMHGVYAWRKGCAIWRYWIFEWYSEQLVFGCWVREDIWQYVQVYHLHNLTINESTPFLSIICGIFPKSWSTSHRPFIKHTDTQGLIVFRNFTQTFSILTLPEDKIFAAKPTVFYLRANLKRLQNNLPFLQVRTTTQHLSVKYNLTILFTINSASWYF